jgi:hypothetical protein
MQRLAYRVLTSFVTLTLIASLRGQNAHKVGEIEDFRLQGVAIWQCQCPAYACA